MKIIAYKCPDTCKIFESYSSYRSHRLNYISNRRDMNRRTKYISEIDKKISEFRTSAKSIFEISDWIIKNSNLLATRAKASNGICENYQTSDFQLKLIEWETLNFSDNCSNSHVMPLTGGDLNWGGLDKTLPTGYPGFYGSVSFTMNNYTDIMDWTPLDIFDCVGFRTSRGFGWQGSYCNINATLFAMDWPELCRPHIENIAFKKLTG